MSDESNSPDTSSTEDTSQLVAQLSSYTAAPSQENTPATSTAAQHNKGVLIAPAPSQPQAVPPPNATPLPKSLGGQFGAASWAADARNRKPSQNGVVQQIPSTPANNRNASASLPQPDPGQGQYISPYYVDVPPSGNAAAWPAQLNQAQLNQPQHHHQQQQQQQQHQKQYQPLQGNLISQPSPALGPNSQASSPWTPGIQAQNSPLPNDVATPGAATPAVDGDDSDSDTAEQHADGSSDPKYRNRNGSRQRLRHEDKINVIRTAIELFPKVKPRWRQLNDFWAQVGQVYEARYGKSVGKIRPMADRLIKIHRAYVERCEQIPGSHRDETSMTKTLDEWIALEDPLKTMSKTWQLSQHDVDGNRSWPTKKRVREDLPGDTPERTGVDPSMRALMPQASILNQMNNGMSNGMNNGMNNNMSKGMNNGHPPPGFSQQFQSPHNFPPPPPQVYFPQNDPRMNNGAPQRPPPSNGIHSYSSPYPNGMTPNGTNPNNYANNMNPPTPTPIQALSAIEEAMKALGNALQKGEQQQQRPAPQVVAAAPSNLEKKVERLSKRLDKLEDMRKKDMEEIRSLFRDIKEMVWRREAAVVEHGVAAAATQETGEGTAAGARAGEEDGEGAENM